MFERCTEERERKLDFLKTKVKDSYKNEEKKHKKAKLAYVDAVAKPPRGIMRLVAINGRKNLKKFLRFKRIILTIFFVAFQSPGA